MISKKKKVITCFGARLVSFSGRKLRKSCSHTGVDLFFLRSPLFSKFLEFDIKTIVIIVIMSCLGNTEFCTPLIKLFWLTEAKSGIFDQKSGTRPEKAGRMVTLCFGFRIGSCFGNSVGKLC